MSNLKQIEIDYQLADGTGGRIAVPNRSRIAWDETRGKRGWPTAQDALSLWQTFLAWHALTRSGRYPGKFDQFIDDALIVEVVDAKDDEEAGSDVDPTRLSPEPEWSSDSV